MIRSLKAAKPGKSTLQFTYGKTVRAYGRAERTYNVTFNVR